MKRFDWTGKAYDELAAVYVDLPPEERERLAALVERINRRLRDDPEGYGESRDGENRVLIADHLTVWYRVRSGPDTLVYHIHWSGPRPNPPDDSAV